VAELYKIAVVHLYVQGFTSEELLNFELELANPSTIYKRQQVDLLNEKIQLVQAMKETRLFSDKYIYEQIFDMSEDEWKNMRDNLIEDLKEEFRKEQIVTEGNDPKVTKRSFGTPHDLASMQMASSISGEGVKNMYTTDEREDNPGAPTKGGSFGRDKDMAFGRDPDGRKANDAGMKVDLKAHTIRGLHAVRSGKPLNILREDKQSAIRNTLKGNPKKEDVIKMLDESSLLSDL
jgi:hypothetical protein